MKSFSLQKQNKSPSPPQEWGRAAKADMAHGLCTATRSPYKCPPCLGVPLSVSGTLLHLFGLFLHYPCSCSLAGPSSLQTLDSFHGLCPVHPEKHTEVQKADIQAQLCAWSKCYRWCSAWKQRTKH